VFGQVSDRFVRSIPILAVLQFLCHSSTCQSILTFGYIRCPINKGEGLRGENILPHRAIFDGTVSVCGSGNVFV